MMFWTLARKRRICYNFSFISIIYEGMQGALNER